MVPRSHRRRVAPALVSLLALALLAVGAGPAGAAKLVGGARQTALEKAFAKGARHRGLVVVSVRSSTVQRSWAVVRSVRPEGGGRSRGAARTPKLQSSYYQLVHGSERAGTPPKAVRADLAKDFTVAVLYRGSGSETVSFSEATGSVCVGGGQNVDQQQDSVTPMTWSVRYLVDLDRLQAAVRDSQGTMLVPTVSYDYAGSTVDAVEKLSRSTVDVGCAGKTTSAACTTIFQSGGPDPGAQLSFDPGAGLEIGVPTRSSGTGTCGAENYTLGPTLWDSGATIAQVAKLGLVGGTLPANPYGRISVAWPASSALAAADLIASPCQGDEAACSDAMRWTGTVQLQPVSTS
jgi:hypothetical protein